MTSEPVPDPAPVGAPFARRTAARPQRGGWPALAALLLLNGLVAAGGSVAASSGVDGWYAQAATPDWTPPNWVFAPVWTVLYVLMAVAAWYVWQERQRPGGRTALMLYGVQLALNALWTPLFFAGQHLGAALAVILALEIALVATIVAFHRVVPRAAWLLGPYLAWTLYATTLNAGVAALA